MVFVFSVECQNHEKLIAEFELFELDDCHSLFIHFSGENVLVGLSVVIVYWISYIMSGIFVSWIKSWMASNKLMLNEKKDRRKLILASITSRLDCCNATLYTVYLKLNPNAFEK